MKHATRLFLLAVLAAGSFNATAQKNSSPKQTKSTDISMFPKPEQGFKQIYIAVPSAPNEEDLKIEVFAGKAQAVDCNRYSMQGTVTEENLEGWGYTYYKIQSNGQMVGTLMGCPDQKKTVRFIYMSPQLIRYNSKLPVVLYVPQDIEVRYRIWRADKTMRKAPQAKATSKS